MSGDTSQDYFSDGISEELLNLLAQIPELKVAARTSSFSFKGKEVEIPEIGRRLNVTHVLEGSVRRAGDRVRITAQLVQTADGFHVWSQTYDRTFDDVFTMQDEIAADVVKELKVSFLGEAPKARTTDPQAYALFLQGRDVSRQLSPRSLALSDSLYQTALMIDSTYAPAWVGLSSNYVNEISFGFMKSSEGFQLSRGAALKALQFDPDNGVAYSRLGIIAMWADNDLDSAARYFERAVALDHGHEHRSIPVDDGPARRTDGAIACCAGARSGQRELPPESGRLRNQRPAVRRRDGQAAHRARAQPRPCSHALHPRDRVRPQG
jgi:TolB-like protein